MQKILLTLIAACVTTAHAEVLTPYQSLDTTGARKIEPFMIDGKHYIAVPQLATDVMSKPANMNGGDSNADVLVYQWKAGKFDIYQRIKSHGNEDATFFTIGNRRFLTVARIDEGSAPPFNFKTKSTVFEWDGKEFKPFQEFNSFAAKQFSAFSIGNRHFIGLANGVVPPNGKAIADTSSFVYEWNGKQFEKFQTFPTKWSYGFYLFQIGKEYFLGLTDHLQATQIYKWDGKQFKPFQTIDQTGGRAFLHFQIQKQDYLAYANLTHPSQILKWNGKKFDTVQTLSGLGSRNFAFFINDKSIYLAKIYEIRGQRENPVTKLDSVVYQWKAGEFQPVQYITTYGGTSVAAFTIDQQQYVGVSNSLSEAVRFKVCSVIYQVK